MAVPLLFVQIFLYLAGYIRRFGSHAAGHQTPNEIAGAVSSGRKKEILNIDQKLKGALCDLESGTDRLS